ncbi:hypothetical protein FSP39_010575 [Pinctada imbricata]|uniref:Uncharacterized protein n=1 Tax=Pinctada imbricata TaxID=66713 RepID=A0AA89BP10_PINIB|nr:hypothetical protein FSP39_010575 [Pinctada imbricata]
MQNCYQGNRIPREYLHHQSDEQPAQSLGFVKELVDENKKLKQSLEEYELQSRECAELHKLAEESQERIKQIQEQYLKRADEINAMLAEKHKGEMMLVVDEKLEIERRLTDEIARLKARIQDLEKTNRELLAKLSSISESEEKLSLLQMQYDEEKRSNRDLKLENLTLNEEIERLQREGSGRQSSLDQINTLRHQNEALTLELQEVNQKNTELNYRIGRLEKQIQESAHEQDKNSLIENLKVKIVQMQKERGIATEKEQQQDKLIKHLYSEIDSLQQTLSKTENAKQKLNEEHQKLLQEYEKFKKQYMVDSQHKTFKDFVDLKRQLSAVKNENEDLKYIAKAHAVSSLPSLKESVSHTKDSSRRKRSGSFKTLKMHEAIRNK